MTPDRLDALIRTHFPPAQVPPEQVERVMAGVFAQLDCPAPAPVPRWRAWLDFLGEITPDLPALMRQSALPAGIAVVLGLYVGQALQAGIPDASLASLVTSPPVLMAGY